MSKTTELVERLRELPRDTHKATVEIYDLCIEASYEIEELTDRGPEPEPDQDGPGLCQLL